MGCECQSVLAYILLDIQYLGVSILIESMRCLALYEMIQNNLKRRYICRCKGKKV